MLVNAAGWAGGPPPTPEGAGDTLGSTTQPQPALAQWEHGSGDATASGH